METKLEIGVELSVRMYSECSEDLVTGLFFLLLIILEFFVDDARTKSMILSRHEEKKRSNGMIIITKDQGSLIYI